MITEDVYNLTSYRVCTKDEKTIPIIITIPHVKITYNETQVGKQEIEVSNLEVIPENNILCTIQLEEE